VSKRPSIEFVLTALKELAFNTNPRGVILNRARSARGKEAADLEADDDCGSTEGEGGHVGSAGDVGTLTRAQVLGEGDGWRERWDSNVGQKLVFHQPASAF
jgi:hypothetical protein